MFYACKLESPILNLDNLEERRSNLCVKFAKSGIKYQKLDDLFPVKEKKHKMEVRQDNKYEVTFSNTERLKNSSIPTIQHYLNDDYKETRKKRKCG